MQQHRSFKFELRPDGEQARKMRRFAGSCRFVFNKGLALQKQLYEAGEKKLTYAGLCKQLTAWRHDVATSWLSEAPIHPLQQALRDLERAYTNFFAKRAAFPKFAKKGERESFRYPDPKQFKLDDANGRIFLPKLGWVRYRASRSVLGELCNVTVSWHAGRWYISVETMREVPDPLPTASTTIGIDLGIARFATLSDGTHIAPIASFKQHEQRLRIAQQALARKQKGSRNWKKAKAHIQRVQARIANVRRDFLHKASTTISKNHAVVIVEDLKVQSMSASVKGTLEEPGRQVAQKRGLNRSILDQGWFEFRRQLEYKLRWSGGQLLAVPAAYTSRTCPCCGHAEVGNRPSQAVFCCLACGFEGHADHVAALNIRRAGLARIACEVSDAVMSPAAGTHRSDSGEAQCLA